MVCTKVLIENHERTAGRIDYQISDELSESRENKIFVLTLKTIEERENI